jgi:hypothetical protein
MKGSATMRLMLPFVALLVIPALAQSSAAERARLLQEYRQAFSEWMQADAQLDESAAPQDVLKQLRDVENKWSAAASARSRYIKAIAPVHQKHASALAGALVLPVDAVPLETAVQKTLTDLSTDLTALEQEIASGRFSRRRTQAMQAQQEALEDLHKLYRDRQQALEQLRQLGTSIERNRAAAAETYASLVGALAAQEASLDADSARWNTAYEQMRLRAVQQGGPSPQRRTTGPIPVISSKATQPQTLSGKWVLSEPRPEKFRDAAGPLYGDVSVTVQLVQNGNQISGEYTGVVFVPPGEKYNPNVNFRFSGRLGPKPVTEATIDSPLAGVVRIERVDNDRIRISYQIARTSKAASGISFKVGEPKELHRVQ